MSRIESINQIKVYEENGQDCGFESNPQSITIREHWNIRNFVVIKIGETSYTVVAKDLIAAIQNAQNAHT